MGSDKPSGDHTQVAALAIPEDQEDKGGSLGLLKPDDFVNAVGSLLKLALPDPVVKIAER